MVAKIYSLPRRRRSAGSSLGVPGSVRPAPGRL